MLITFVFFSAVFGFMVGLIIAIEKQRRKVKNFNKNVVPIEFTGVVSKSFPAAQFEIKNNVVDLTAPKLAAVNLVLKEEGNIFVCDRDKITLNLKEGDKIKGFLYQYALDIRNTEIDYYYVLRNVMLIDQT